jgi:phosphatidylinositol glycan class B
LTWEWQSGIRGFTHPFLFALLYKALAILRLDYPLLVVRLDCSTSPASSHSPTEPQVLAPKLFQALMAALGDLMLYKIAAKWYSSSVAYYTVCDWQF